MKSSRSVSCSAPLKGDAMAAVLPLGSGRQTARDGTLFPPRCRKAPRAAHARLPTPRACAPCWRTLPRGGACGLPRLLGTGGAAKWTRVTCRPPRAHLPARYWELAEAAGLLYLVPRALKTPEGCPALTGTQIVLRSE